MRKVNEMNEEEAIRSYAIYKKKLPKDFRTESKTRIAMFKESLRISCQVSARLRKSDSQRGRFMVVYTILLLFVSCFRETT